MLMDPRPGREMWSTLEESFEEGVQAWRRKKQFDESDSPEKAAYIRLMRRMLAFQPEDRPTAEEVLSSDWMAQLCLPDFERAQWGVR